MNKFEEALKTSREETRQHRNRALEMQRKRAKKEERQNIILTVFLLIGLILAISISMKLGQQMTSECEQYHSKQYCERGL